MLLPLETLPIRRALNQWFAALGVRPRIAAEFEDSALLKVFGGDGLGIFAGPTAVEAEVKRQYGVEIVGRIPDVRERFYAISAERRLQNPAVLAIRETARHEIFARA
jgi:LysR family transcriptional activator of nhaA